MRRRGLGCAAISAVVSPTSLRVYAPVLTFSGVESAIGKDTEMRESTAAARGGCPPATRLAHHVCRAVAQFGGVVDTIPYHDGKNHGLDEVADGVVSFGLPLREPLA